MWDQRNWISLRISSVFSKVEPDLYTGFDQNVPAPQHCIFLGTSMVYGQFFSSLRRLLWPSTSESNLAAEQPTISVPVCICHRQCSGAQFGGAGPILTGSGSCDRLRLKNLFKTNKNKNTVWKNKVIQFSFAPVQKAGSKMLAIVGQDLFLTSSEL